MERGYSMVVMMLTALVAMEKHVTHGCLCEGLRHPQDRFCSAKYVIIGRILEKNEDVNEDSFPQFPVGPHIPGDDISDESLTKETVPQSAESTFSGLPPLRKVQAPEQPMVFPPLMMHDEPQPFYGGALQWSGKLKYIVQVEKVFKGQNRITRGKKVVIETDMSSSMCGVTHLRVDGKYLISGSFDGEKLHIYTCDWVQETTELTKSQRRGLRHFYSKYCNVCQIETGRIYFPGDLKAKTVCTYNSHMYSGVDCEGKYSSCIKRPNGTCGWYKGKDYKTCRKTLTYKRSWNQD